jgi:hypothetical protein
MSGESMSAGEDQFDERTAKLLGTGAGLMNGVAIAAACFFVFESNVLVFGAVVGAFSGVGSALFLPWLFQQQAEQELDAGGQAYDDQFSSTTDESDGGINTAALGIGLEVGAIVMFAARLVLEDMLLGIGAGVALALVVFLVSSVLFGRVE